MLLAVGMITAFAVSIFIIRFLMNFIKNHSFIAFGIQNYTWSSNSAPLRLYNLWIITYKIKINSIGRCRNEQ